MSDRLKNIKGFQNCIKTADAAKLLGASPLTIRKWVRNGVLSAIVHPINGYRLFDLEEIMDLIDTARREALENKEKIILKALDRKVDINSGF